MKNNIDNRIYLAPSQNSTGATTRLTGTDAHIGEGEKTDVAVNPGISELDLALETGRMGIWEWDIKANCIKWSSHLYEMFGFTKESLELTPAGILKVVHPDDRPHWELLIESLKIGKCNNHEVEFRILRGDNQAVVWSHFRGTVRRDQDGKAVSMLSVVVDITERKTREFSLEFMAEMQATLANLTLAEDIIAASSQMISEFLNLSHFALSEVDEQAINATVVSDYCSDGSQSLMGVYQMSEFATNDERQQLAAGHPMVVADTTAITRSHQSSANFAKLGIGAIINAPGNRDKQLRFMLSAIKRQRYDWRQAEVDLMRHVANVIRLKLDRAYAEKALQESEAKFRDLADNIAPFAWMSDATGSINWYNQRWFDYTGKKLDEMRNWGWKSVQHPDHLDRVVEYWQECLASGEVWEDTFPLRSKDGTYRWFLSRAQPIRDDTGRIVRWFGTNTDITEWKQAEQLLAESEQRLRNAAEAAGFGTVHADLLNGTVTYSQELRQILGIPGQPNEPIRTTGIPEWVHPEDRASCLAHYKELSQLPEGSAGKIDHRILRSNGEIRWVRLQTKPIYTGIGTARRATQLIGTVLDITLQREFEQSLHAARLDAEAANRSKSEFLANMSHEIRTPMTAILGFADLVAEKIDDDEVKDHIRTIRRNGDFLLEIINDILDLSKIEAGKFEISQQFFSPEQLIEDVRSIMEVRASGRKIDLQVEYCGYIPAQIESDPKRLRQILINLVGNAIKFTAKGYVRLVVSYMSQERRLRFEIIDTGIGINDTLKEQLFQPFSQGNGHVNREFGGTGLGLVISKRLTEMLGGQILVESELGKGSVFTVTIAAEKVSDVALVPSPTDDQLILSSPQSVGLQPGCKILVVDDRRDVRFLSKRLLTDAGAAVTEADNGEVAVATVIAGIERGESFDLILLDMQMPKLDGYATAKVLRKLGYTNPIVAMTADAMQGDMTRCIACGCNDYLSKPIDKVLLLNLVSKLTSPQKNMP